MPLLSRDEDRERERKRCTAKRLWMRDRGESGCVLLGILGAFCGAHELGMVWSMSAGVDFYLGLGAIWCGWWLLRWGPGLTWLLAGFGENTHCFRRWFGFVLTFLCPWLIDCKISKQIACFAVKHFPMKFRGTRKQYILQTLNVRLLLYWFRVSRNSVEIVQ